MRQVSYEHKELNMEKADSETVPEIFKAIIKAVNEGDLKHIHQLAKKGLKIYKAQHDDTDELTRDRKSHLI